MKKYTSVLMMCARQSVYKILVVIGIMVIWEWRVFLDSTLMLSGIYDGWSLYGILFLAWMAITIILAFYGCRIRQGSANLLRRIQISRGKLFWVQTLYNAMVYVSLLNVQLILLYFMGMQYSQRESAYVGPQTIFLALEDAKRFTSATQAGLLEAFFVPSVTTMASPFVSVADWVCRIVSIAIFSMIAASITTGILNTEDD